MASKQYFTKKNIKFGNKEEVNLEGFLSSKMKMISFMQNTSNKAKIQEELTKIENIADSFKIFISENKQDKPSKCSISCFTGKYSTTSLDLEKPIAVMLDKFFSIYGYDPCKISTNLKAMFKNSTKECLCSNIASHLMNFNLTKFIEEHSDYHKTYNAALLRKSKAIHRYTKTSCKIINKNKESSVILSRKDDSLLSLRSSSNGSLQRR